MCGSTVEMRGACLYYWYITCVNLLDAFESSQDSLVILHVIFEMHLSIDSSRELTKVQNLTEANPSLFFLKNSPIHKVTAHSYHDTPTMS
jgi:hypothetical protein